MTVAIRAKQRVALRERAEHMCEVRIPGICKSYGTNAHHRKNASQGGTDELSNLLLCCGSGTTGCHGWITENPGESKRNGWSMWRSNDPPFTPVRYRGQWARLDNEGNVHILKRGKVRNDLGHLSIAH